MKFRILLPFLFVSFSLFAQTDSFKIITVNGAVQAKDDVGKIVEIKYGEWFEFKTVVIAKLTYVLIQNSSNHLLEFRTKHSKQLNLVDLFASRTEDDKKLSLWSANAIDSLLTTKSLQAFKLYSMPEQEIILQGDPLLLFPPNTKIYDKEILVEWKKIYNNSYTVTLEDENGKVLFIQNTSSTSFKLNLNNFNYPTDRCLMVSVKVANSKYTSKNRCIYKTNIGETSNITLDIYPFELLYKPESAIHNLIMAQLCEKHQLNYKAEKYYKAAYTITGYDAAYKKLYFNYLNRRLKVEIE